MYFIYYVFYEYIYIYIYTCLYIYIYRERERDRERERERNYIYIMYMLCTLIHYVVFERMESEVRTAEVFAFLVFKQYVL